MPKAVETKPTGLDLFSKVLEKRKSEKKRIWFIYGPKKIGKTTLAMTISKHFGALNTSVKDRLNKVKSGSFEPISLDDVAWLSIDTDATQCALDMGAHIQYDFQLDDVMAEGYTSPHGAMSQLLDALKEGLPDSVEWVVVDTISQFALRLEDYCGSVKGDEGFGKWGFLSRLHGEFHLKLTKLGRNVIYLCHPKGLMDLEAKTDAGKKAAENQRRKHLASFGHTPEIIPSIRGSGADVYLNNSSFNAVLLEKRVSNTEKEVKLFTDNSFGFEAGSRIESILPKDKNGAMQPNLWEIRRAIDERERFITPGG